MAHTMMQKTDSLPLRTFKVVLCYIHECNFIYGHICLKVQPSVFRFSCNTTLSAHFIFIFTKNQPQNMESTAKFIYAFYVTHYCH
jgi:hypothetical protein